MTPPEFLKLFRAAVDLEPSIEIDMNTVLEDLPTWDSLAVVSLISEFDLKLNVVTSAEKIHGCVTVGDVFKLVQRR